MTEAAEAAASSPWALLLVYAFTAVDGFFPPVPSESAVIAVAALAGPGDGARIALLWLLAAAGAYTGDQAAYSLGRRVLTSRRRRLAGRPRALHALERAERAVVDRDVAVVLVARFVPGGRVAVNMTAGAVGLPRGRFSALAGLAAVLWSAYSVGLGLGAARLLGADPLVAAALGVALGALVGVVVERVVRWRRRRRAVRAVIEDVRVGQPV
ncbi:DedA family protein [Actinotalea sp. Marseille-Q4924]|uniref:DedA family protein n=1 Tax=Actinotalea sp. Marseille-Q4924 TaxID=2866571 RepID=UPI001CE3FD99|nr:VTT domain-containing protein [Actinotalea sp. Marseille-Q4924]